MASSSSPSNDDDAPQAIQELFSEPPTGFDPADTTSARWRNYFNLLTGRMNNSGRLAYKRHRDVLNEASDCARCEKQRDFLFQYSPIVRFMLSKIEVLGGDLNERNVLCRRCPIGAGGVFKGGGFDPVYGIQICANAIPSRGVLEDTLAHEMMHVWDHLRWKVDFTGESGSLRHAACTEIRASNLSGECRWLREFFQKSQWHFTKQQQECVRRRAILSVMARPACKTRDQAIQAVDEVWENCYHDTRPFDDVYR